MQKYTVEITRKGFIEIEAENDTDLNERLQEKVTTDEDGINHRLDTTNWNVVKAEPVEEEKLYEVHYNERYAVYVLGTSPEDAVDRIQQGHTTNILHWEFETVSVDEANVEIANA